MRENAPFIALLGSIDKCKGRVFFHFMKGTLECANMTFTLAFVCHFECHWTFISPCRDFHQAILQTARFFPPHPTSGVKNLDMDSFWISGLKY